MSLSRQVSDELEHMIEAGEYAVGQRIPTESELMEMFSVSRNTLREAVQSLTSAGVLEVRQGDGTYVISDSRFNANMNKEFEKVSLEDVRETRDVMEVAIARLAARRRTEEELEEICAALENRQGLKENVKENTLADMEFHMAIARASHNHIFLELYTSMLCYLENQIAQRQAFTTLDQGEIDALHEKLCLAIQERDEDGAVRYAREIISI